MDGGKTFGYGVHDSRDPSISFMGAFVEGVLHLRFQCNLFPSPFIAFCSFKVFLG
jgi:hypothetical protein